MSSFYEDASLVMIPSGYKTSKVYSAKPTDGAGDLSFTRSNDTATRVGPDGLIEKVRTNLLTYSNTFSNAVWQISGTPTLTANYDTNPLTGANDAWRFQSASSSDRIYQAFSGSFHNFSLYAKGTGTIRLRDSSGTYSFNMVLTSSWQRASVHIPASFGNVQITSDGGCDATIYAAQLETGDIATDYIATTTAAVSVGPVANVPRLDYLGSSCPRLLLEPQRQNVCLWSEQIDNAGWTKTNAPTITTNIATAPDGYGGADGIQDTTGGTFKRIRQTFSVTANSTNTASVFVKKETTQTNFGGLALTYTGSTTKYAYGIVNPIAGTIVVSSDSVIGAASTKVEDYGDWWRFSLTATDNGSNTTLEIAYYGTLSTNGTSAGVAAGSVRTVWGFQLEIGASYASSYVNTLGAAVTRGADACVKTGISSLIGQTEGTIFIDLIASAEIADTGGAFSVLFTAGEAGTNFQIYTAGTNLKFYKEPGTIDFSSSVNLVKGQRYKIAYAYKAGDYAFYVNGVQVGTSVNGTVPSASSIYINRFSTGTFQAQNNFNQVLLFPTRLSNSSLAELTA